MEYDIRFGKLHVGSGDMEVLPMDTVRGRDAWHTLFRVSGGVPFYHVNDRYEDWIDARTLASLRYWQDIDEGNYEPKRHFEIFPERREYIENEQAPQPERRASARRGLVSLLPAHHSASHRYGHELRRLLPRRPQSGALQGPAPRYDRACRPGGFTPSSCSPSSSRSSSPRAATQKSGFPTTRTASCCR